MTSAINLKPSAVDRASDQLRASHAVAVLKETKIRRVSGADIASVDGLVWLRPEPGWSYTDDGRQSRIGSDVAINLGDGFVVRIGTGEFAAVLPFRIPAEDDQED